MQTDVTAPAPPPPVVFTDAAATKVGELIEEEQNPELMLRVFISGGGCSGFQYGFTFDEKVEDGDSEVVNQGVKLVQGRSARCAVHHPQPERDNNLRLWIVLLNLIPPLRSSLPLTSDPIVFT